MKLITLNTSMFDRNNDQLESFLSHEEADILCLQEIIRRIDDTASAELISKDAVDKATKNFPYSFYAPAVVFKDFQKGKFHGKEVYTFDFGGFIETGTYIKSKFPIYAGKFYNLVGTFVYVTDWNIPDSANVCRGVQVTDLKIDGKNLRILNYHGIWSKDKQGTEVTLQACKTIRDLALEVDYPSIICGDFNLFPDTESMKVFYDDFESLVDTYAVKTTRPQSNELSNLERNVVDFILVSKGIKVNDFKVLDNDVSDHLPLIMDFDLE